MGLWPFSPCCKPFKNGTQYQWFPSLKGHISRLVKHSQNSGYQGPTISDNFSLLPGFSSLSCTTTRRLCYLLGGTSGKKVIFAHIFVLSLLPSICNPSAGCQFSLSLPHTGSPNELFHPSTEQLAQYYISILSFKSSCYFTLVFSPISNDFHLE